MQLFSLVHMLRLYLIPTSHHSLDVRTVPIRSLCVRCKLCNFIRLMINITLDSQCPARPADEAQTAQVGDSCPVDGIPSCIGTGFSQVCSGLINRCESNSYALTFEVPQWSIIGSPTLRGRHPMRRTARHWSGRNHHNL